MADPATASFPAPGLIGTFRTFGPAGPAYQVVAPLQSLPDGDWVIQVRVLESGEDAEYRYTDLLEDPEAA
jgi:hypothetical protein